VALGTALGLINGSTPYKAKVLFLSPLVALAMEQYAHLKRVAKAQSKLIPSRKIKVAYRMKMDPSPNLRSSQWIAATYEHGRNVLTDGNIQIYPGSNKLKRRLHQSIRLVVIDEIHHLASDRGHVVSSIRGLCLHFKIPVLVMTGTPHELIRIALKEIYEDRLTTIINKDESLCHQLVIRIDDDATLHEMIIQSLFANMQNGWLRQG
jgi:superfamily II helicase